MIKQWLRRWLLDTPSPQPLAATPRRMNPLVLAEASRVAQPVQTYTLQEPPPGVRKPAQLAMDGVDSLYGWANNSIANGAFDEGIGFLGYPYLAQLSQRAEYRTPCERLAKEMTRKWIRVTSTGEDDLGEKVEALSKAIETFDVRQVIRKAIEQDSYFGRAQIYIDTGDFGQELATPLLPKAKVKKGTLKGFRTVEALWSYPQQYNTTNPLAGDFYVPQTWIVMSDIVHRSRLLTLVSRPVADILKPAYQFGGMALTQLAKPYVDNWLSTRQSVNDLLQAFSQMVLATDLGSTLTGVDQGQSLFDRVDLFNRTRNNRGTMVVDKGSEELTNIAVPLTTLDMLQAQAQEHMAAVYAIPLVVLLGITPSGLNASSDGEIRTFYTWIHAQQEDVVRPVLQAMFEVLQLNEFGAIDERLGFEFVELWEESKKEAADRRKVEADTDGVYIDKGVISPDEVRERIARSAESGYDNLDLAQEAPGLPDPADEGDPLDDDE